MHKIQAKESEDQMKTYIDTIDQKLQKSSKEKGLPYMQNFIFAECTKII